jgi:hypothetical protein
MKKDRSKYGLAAMNVGDEKSFPLKLWDKIRLSAHFVGKRHERVYRTQKVGKKIFVFRDE